MERTLQDIKNISIIGSGTLGLRIGLRTAMSGYKTTIYDINTAAFDLAKANHEHILNDLIKRGIISRQ